MCGVVRSAWVGVARRCCPRQLVVLRVVSAVWCGAAFRRRGLQRSLSPRMAQLAAPRGVPASAAMAGDASAQGEDRGSEVL